MAKFKKGFWKEKNVFVTGADGFIAGWIAERLVREGANVIVIVRDLKVKNSFDALGFRKKVNIVQGDITDTLLMQRILNEFSVDYVYHLAAQAIVGTANRNPLTTFETNIKGTWNILEAARNCSTIKGVIVASSDKAYGDQEKLPYKEDQPLNGLYPYDASKVCTDVLTRCYFKTYGLPVAVTRNANTYGGGDMNFNRIVPGTIKSVLEGEVPIIRSDGTLERDYMYIKDAVDAYLLIGENMDRNDVKGQAFNFGVAKPVSVIELFDKIIKNCGRNVKPKILNQANNEIKKQYLCVDKVKKTFDWEPKYTLDAGLKETIEWYKKYLASEKLAKK